MNRHRILGFSPFGHPSPVLVEALGRAGATGVLELGQAGSGDALAELLRRGVRFGVRLPLGTPLPDSALGVDLVVAEAVMPTYTSADRPQTLVAVTSLTEARAAEAAGADGLVAKGHESGGRVGEESAFVLLQRLVANCGIPVWAQGGMGQHTAGAAMVGGAAGIVLDSQLALMPEAGLPEAIRTAIAGMDGGETRVIDGYRVFDRPDLPIAELAAGLPGTLGVGPLDTCLLPAGQDAALAAGLSTRYSQILGLIRGLHREIDGHRGQAASARPHAPGSAFARQHGLTYPIVQGPMTRVSDTPEFAEAVSAAGALPFIALSLVRGEPLRQLLTQTAARLGDRPWGVGMLGFAPPELREEQLDLVRQIQPPAALLAGGRPAQARALEADGIPTYLHVPSPGLLDLFLRDGARRFVFEGRECGGHVGPRTSFVLWEQFVERLLNHDAVHELSVLFAGGIHDARSAAMVSTLAAPLAVRGAKIGFLMGTAYLFTEEAVSTGAIQPGFQRAAVDCGDTRLVHTAPGHATRCADTEFVTAFEDTRRRLEAEGQPPDAVWEALERLNLGRLRIASKGIRRDGDDLVTVDADTQRREGMFMIGQVAALRSQTTTLAQLHRDISEGPDAFVSPPEASDAAGVDVAIIGMSGVFAGATDLDAFWENVVLGRDAVTEVPKERWSADLYFDPDTTDTSKSLSKWGGFLPAVGFDPLSFGIPPRSLPSVEPVQLLALQVARDALDDAGYGQRPFDRERTSVVFGAEAGTDLASAYGMRAMLPQYVGEVPEALDAVLPKLTEDSFPGVLGNVIAGRIANRLDLGGVNYTVDAACASSLAALDLAVKELASGTSDLVIAGGADSHNAIGDFLLFSSVRALSRTGRSRPFDADADGIALGEGVVAIVCKRLADAQRDGDRIYAVIKGIAGSSDGKSLGLTAPRRQGQMLALERAYARAGVAPTEVGLVEAHGTGTVVGDRTELGSLTDMFTRAGTAPGTVTLGSVKSNVGHTKCAAGLAGVVKVALALHHRVLPPSLHIVRPNPAWIPEVSPFVFRSRPAPWTGDARYGAVSAFGFGGTNFHTILAAHGDGDGLAGMGGWPAEVFLFRAEEDLDRVLAWLDVDPGVRLADLAAAVARRGQGPVRIAIVAEDRDDLRTKVIQARGGQDNRGVFRAKEGQRGKIAFLFPGQGSQRPGMLADLFVAFPALQDLLPAGWASLMFPGDAYLPEQRKQQRQALTDTRRAQPALGIASLAAARVLDWIGVVPDQLGGHSYGELAALCVAGALKPDELFGLSRARGQAILDAVDGDPGTMAAAATDATTTQRILDGAGLSDVVVANHNGPRQTVIAGPSPRIPEAMAALEEAGIEVRGISVAAAFHSPLVAGADDNMRRALSGVHVGAPRRPVYANVTARPYPDDPEEVRALLCEHVVRPVRFRDQLEAMYADGARLFVEVGPGRVLTGLVEQIFEGRDHLALSMEDPRGGGALEGLVRLLAQLAVAGVPIEAGPLFAGRTRVEVDLDATPPEPAASTWWINGQRAWPHQGPLPDYAMKVVTEPLGLSLAGGDRREQVVMEYLKTLRQQAEAQRQVLLSFLGDVPAELEAALDAPLDEAAHGGGAAEAVGVADEREPGEVLLQLVSERTGYPIEMLDLDLDLEADLSIDSIKRIEILGALAETLGQQPSRGLDQERLVEDLAGVKTLRGILEWIADQRDDDLERLVTDEVPQGSTVPPHALRFVPELLPLDGPEKRTLSQVRVGITGQPQGGALPDALERAVVAHGARVRRIEPGDATDDLDVLVVLTETDPISPQIDNGALGPTLFDLADQARLALTSGVNHLVVVTCQGGHLGQVVNGTGPAFGAGVSGLVKTIAKEWPLARVRRVDLDPAVEANVAVAQLVPELVDPDGPSEVGYHKGRRLGRRFALHELEAHGRDSAIQRDSVVLLTGGARGITSRVARAFAERYGCTLVLLGRSPAPTEAEDPRFADADTAAEVRSRLLAQDTFTSPAQVEAEVRKILAAREVRGTFAAIRAAGSKLMYRSVDVRDATAVQEIIASVYLEFGRLDVVLHGAGINEDKLLRDKTRESFLRVFDTKVQGANNLVRHLRDDVLAVVFFSSVAGAFGNRGQVDYAAANDVLDQLARRVDARIHGRAFSINWGPWGGGGMVTPELEAQYRKRGIGLIDPADGVQRLLDELTSGNDAQVVLMAARPQQMQ